jgi:hypothetical protein
MRKCCRSAAWSIAAVLSAAVLAHADGTTDCIELDRRPARRALAAAPDECQERCQTPYDDYAAAIVKACEAQRDWFRAISAQDDARIGGASREERRLREEKRYLLETQMNRLIKEKEKRGGEFYGCLRSCRDQQPKRPPEPPMFGQRPWETALGLEAGDLRDADAQAQFLAAAMRRHVMGQAPPERKGTAPSAWTSAAPGRLFPRPWGAARTPAFLSAWMAAPLARADVPDPASLPHVLVTSLGGYTGPVLQMQVLDPSGRPFPFNDRALVLEPLKKGAQDALRRRFQEQVRRLGVTPQTLRLDAYCLQFAKEPPAANTVLRLARPEVQARYGAMPRILAAVQSLADEGRLRPDIDPAEYLHSIRQWALWTHEQGFTRERFAAEFVAHTKKNVEAAGRPWNGQVEALVKAAAGGRWDAVRLVLERAAP